jgi:2-dehydro-3-deoxy-D-gluconate 5-dehydrogenase
MNNDELFGKVVLVCRAGLELGHKISDCFAHCGAALALQDYSPINLDPSLKSVREIGVKAEEYIFDISKKISAQVMVDQITSAFGSIDILVNIPAVCPSTPILEMDEWDWQRTMEMNVNAAFLLTQLVGREMSKKGGGIIINLISGYKPAQSIASPAYWTSISALEKFGQAADIELSGKKIRVFTITTDLKTGSVYPSVGVSKYALSEDLYDAEQSQINRITSWILFLSVQGAQLPVGQIIDTNWGVPWSGD